MRTADPSWPTGYSIPQNTKVSTETGAVGQEGPIAVRGLSIGQRVSAIALCITCISWVGDFTPSSLALIFIKITVIMNINFFNY